MQKVGIIGGGAAGFFAAIHVKVNFPEATVHLLEKSTKVLSKVKVSGGGRCNVTNAQSSISELAKAYPRGGKQLKKIFPEFYTKHTIEWFEERGVELVTQEDQCIFPKAQNSQIIIDCFLNEVERLGISVKTSCGVAQLTPFTGGIELTLNTNEVLNYDKVILDELTFNGNLTKLYIGYRNENLSSALFGLDITIGRFNADFDWDNGPVNINNESDEKVEQLIPTSDGGAFAVGWTNYPVYGGSNVFVIKIGPNDELPITAGIQPINALVSVVDIANPERTIYPNPTRESITIEGVSLPFDYSVYSSLGELFLKGSSLDASLSLAFLQSGIYYLKLNEVAAPIRIIKID